MDLHLFFLNIPVCFHFLSFTIELLNFVANVLSFPIILPGSQGISFQFIVRNIPNSSSLLFFIIERVWSQLISHFRSFQQFFVNSLGHSSFFSAILVVFPLHSCNLMSASLILCNTFDLSQMSVHLHEIALQS